MLDVEVELVEVGCALVYGGRWRRQCGSLDKSHFSRRTLD